MLISYSFKNFCSFKDKYTFSMKPGRYMDRFSNNIIELNDKNRLLKTAVIVGENGGGKTKFITSLDFLQFMFNQNDTVCSIKKLINNNCVKNEDRTQEFCICVIAENDLVYTYELILDELSVLHESLSFNTLDNSNMINIFESDRTTSYNTTENDKKKELNYHCIINEKLFKKEMIESFRTVNNLKFNGLLVTKFCLLDDKYINPFVNWIKKTLIVESPSLAPLSEYLRYKKEEVDVDIISKKSYLEILQLVDSTIIDVEVDEEKPFEDTQIVRRSGNDELFKIEIGEESSGIKEYFAWAIDIWKVIYQNKVLFADEMDKVLNPILSEKIIAYIHGMKHKGQFIFSTHNILHLNTVNFMKQQLWFVTKNKEDLTSKLYSLADFPEFRYDKTNIYDLYLKGILGGTSYD